MNIMPLRLIQNVENLGSAPLVVPIRLDKADEAALAEFLGVIAIENFQAELHLRRWGGRGVAVEGQVSAMIVQTCVVSLAPVRSQVRETVTARFLPEAMLERGMDSPLISSNEIDIDPLEEDPPESFNGREIDLGALAVEFLALGIDPYPRAADAALPENSDKQGVSHTGADHAPDAAPNPFQALAVLRDKLKG